MKGLLWLLWLLSASMADAQITNSLNYPTLLKAVNQQLWIPYSEAYQAGDTSRLLRLFSKDFIRVEPSLKKIMDLAQYSQDAQQSFRKNKEEQNRTAIEFRFLERVINENFASERGVYRYSFTTRAGDKVSTFEKFHALSRKELGRWKMTAFYSSHEQRSITPQSYAEARPLDHISKY